jgi:hypothetical protein
MDENENENEKENNLLRDINTGEEVWVLNPHSFCLQTVLINTAYYLYQGKEYRFMLCQARKAGLDTEKKLAA